MNNCFVKNYNIERMKPESGDKELPVHDIRHLRKKYVPPDIIRPLSPVTPANSNFIFP